MGSCPSLRRTGRVFRSVIAMGVLALLSGVSPDDAGATVYNYGVMIQEEAIAGGNSTKWCSSSGATCGGVNSGATTLTHSLNTSDTTTLSGTNDTVSASTTNTDTAGLGDLHLSVVSTAGGAIVATGINDEYWTDTLTVGNQFPANTPLEFQVTLDLSGSVLAGSSGNGTPQGSTATAAMHSYFSMVDNFGDSASNTQIICSDNVVGKGGYCGGNESVPKTYTTVFTTYPGATISLYGFLKGSTDSYGYTNFYSCPPNTCYTNYAATSTVDFADTSQLFIIALNGGSFTSAGGATYAPISATPELPAGFLFGSGLLGLAIVGCRKIGKRHEPRVGGREDPKKEEWRKDRIFLALPGVIL